jgi:hypothetical protein
MTQIIDRFDIRALGALNAIQLEHPWLLDYSRMVDYGRQNVDGPGDLGGPSHAWELELARVYAAGADA